MQLNPVNQPQAYTPPYNPADHSPYPSIRYHRSGTSLRVNSVEEEPEGEDWDKSPFPPQPKSAVTPAVAPHDGMHCAEFEAKVKAKIEEMKDSFRKDWDDQANELANAQEALAAVQTALEALQAENEALVAKQMEEAAPKKSRAKAE
jgi:hypothetical protein